MIKIKYMFKTIFFILLLPLIIFAQVRINPEIVKQGECFSIVILADKEINNLKISFLGKYYNYGVKNEDNFNEYKCIIGIPMKVKPDTYKIYISSDKISIVEKVKVVKNIFKREKINLPKSKIKLPSSPELIRENEEIGRVFKKFRPEQLWNEKFIMPTYGRISSSFGQYRVYNDGTTSWRHKGVDIAGKTGTEILSPNSGEIILVRNYKVHGKTVVIDHGLGVLSIFNHLSEIDVQEGEKVKKGDVIGKVGSTGIATGPHLHWGLSVQDERVNPLQFVEEKF